MRYGAVSYHSEDVLKWKERWQPSERLEDVLRKHHQKKPEVKVRFYSDEYGRVQCTVIESSPGYFTLLKDYLCSCFAWLWNRLFSCFAWLWNRLCSCFAWLWNRLLFCFAWLWNRLCPFRPWLSGRRLAALRALRMACAFVSPG